MPRSVPATPSVSRRRRWLPACLGLLAAVLLCGALPRVRHAVGSVYRGLVARRQVAAGGAEERLRQAASEAGVDYPLREPSIRVDKADRRLTLLSAGRAVKRYRIALGRQPVGDKTRYGDGRTPEGEFSLCTRIPSRSFHLFLGLSYPAPDDAERGYRVGGIDAATRDAILAAAAAHRVPPWETALGGKVGIHGAGTQGDWTLGCIALEDADVDEIWLACPLGTPVSIVP